MKKRVITIMVAAMLAFSATGCTKTGQDTMDIEVPVATVTATAADTTTEESAPAEEQGEEAATDQASEKTSGEDLVFSTVGENENSEKNTEARTEASEEGVVIRVGSLKGPTTMGLVNLMDKAEKKETTKDYEFRMETQPDVIASELIKGNLDIALVPANLAGVLYTKTEGNVAVISINTLGVLYCVTGDESIKSVKDLEGKTVYTTGQGASPEYVMNYLLAENGVNCTLEFKSEATEIAALLAQDPNQIAVLPQPFVTVAEAQNEALKTAFSLSDEWDSLQNGSRLVTGVTVVSKEFLADHKSMVDAFLIEQAESVSAAINDVDGTSELIAKYGIIEKAPIAKKALPYCNITCTTGEEMQKALSGYLDVLREADPSSVGGAIPGDDFYYTGAFVE